MVCTRRFSFSLGHDRHRLLDSINNRPPLPRVRHDSRFMGCIKRRLEYRLAHASALVAYALHPGGRDLYADFEKADQELPLKPGFRIFSCFICSCLSHSHGPLFSQSGTDDLEQTGVLDQDWAPAFIFIFRIASV